MVPYDKGAGFCVFGKDIYENKLSDLLDSVQFSGNKRISDAFVKKIEKDINKELLAMRKKMSENIYTRMMSTGGSPPGFMG